MKQEMMGCSGIGWTICESSAPYARQITMPAPHHLIFTGQVLFLMPTVTSSWNTYWNLS